MCNNILFPGTFVMPIQIFVGIHTLPYSLNGKLLLRIYDLSLVTFSGNLMISFLSAKLLRISGHPHLCFKGLVFFFLDLIMAQIILFLHNAERF